MKPGYKTTEFWLSAAASVVGTLMASGVFAGGAVGTILGVGAAVLSALGYTAIRGVVKREEYRASPYRKQASVRSPQPKK